jgi:hypothetical protein
MLFKTFITISFVIGSVLASPIAQAPVAAGAPVSKALNDITTALAGLRTKVTAWNGDVVDASNILLDADALLRIITTSETTISALSVLPLNEAVTILQPGNQLIKEAQATVDALISKKPEMDKTGLTSVVKTTLTNFKDAAVKTVAAVIKILPDNVKTVGDSIGKQINAALDKGIVAYS